MVEYDERYLSIKEFAAKLNVYHGTIRRALAKGKIGFIKIGKVYRIPESEIRRIALFDLEEMIERIIEKRSSEC